MSAIFQDAGIVYDIQNSDQYTPIVINIGNSETVFQQAPVTGIRIEQQVDFSLAKTMSGNFNLVTFQDLPVTITIQGLRSLYKPCQGQESKESIGQIYKKMKASGANQIVQITIGATKEVYKAAIVALTQMSLPEAPGILTYNLTLFGVRST